MNLNYIFQQIKAGNLQPYFDFDGTLSPFVSVPTDARPQGDIGTNLAKLDKILREKDQTGVLFVTGREYQSMLSLLDNKLTVRGGFEHGAVLVLHDTVQKQLLVNEQQTILSKAYEAVKGYCDILNSMNLGFDVTQLIERKTYSIAVHWRPLVAANLNTINIQTVIDNFHKLLAECFAQSDDFKMLHGDMNFEFHLEAINKGVVIKQLNALINNPYQRPVFFGDDFIGTDGSAAKAVWELGGIVVMVDNGMGRVDNFLNQHTDKQEGVHYLIIRGPEPQQKIDEALKQVLLPCTVEKTFTVSCQNNFSDLSSVLPVVLADQLRNTF